MRILAAAATGLVLLAACDNQTEPAAPPTTQDALTTATATPNPTPDEVDVTTEAAPTTAEAAPTTTEPTTAEPAADDGPPEMPEEAKEQTDAGAEAFVSHYLDRVSWAHRIGDASGLERLAQPDCQSCTGLAESADSWAYGEDYLDYELGDSLLTDATARVEASVQQLVGDGAGHSEVVIRLDWMDNQWRVQEITLVSE